MEDCSHNCHECQGCGGERVILSFDKSISFVSNISFPMRNIEKKKTITLNMEAVKISGDENSCNVGIKLYKNDELIYENLCVYQVNNTTYQQLKYDFSVGAEADKAHVIVGCASGGTLDILHICTFVS